MLILRFYEDYESRSGLREILKPNLFVFVINVSSVSVAGR